MVYLRVAISTGIPLSFSELLDNVDIDIITCSLKERTILVNINRLLREELIAELSNILAHILLVMDLSLMNDICNIIVRLKC